MTAWVLILAGIGIWFLIEGAIYAIAPDFMKRMSAMIARLEPNEIALNGLLAAGLGAGLLYTALRLHG